MTGKGDGVIGYGVVAGVLAIIVVGISNSPEEKPVAQVAEPLSENSTSDIRVASPDYSSSEEGAPYSGGYISGPADLSASASDGAGGSHKARLISEGGVLSVPVTINGLVRANFTVDSGASVVVIPEDLFITMVKQGGVSKSDYIGSEQYTLADGSVVESPVFTIRKLTVGDVTMRDIRGTVTKSGGGLLLGQSFLKRFKKWHIDNDSQELIFEM